MKTITFLKVPWKSIAAVPTLDIKAKKIFF